MHNEELLMQQTALEAKRMRLADLYDYAPVNYVTESESGMIIESKLADLSSRYNGAAGVLFDYEFGG